MNFYRGGLLNQHALKAYSGCLYEAPQVTGQVFNFLTTKTESDVTKAVPAVTKNDFSNDEGRQGDKENKWSNWLFESLPYFRDVLFDVFRKPSLHHSLLLKVLTKWTICSLNTSFLHGKDLGTDCGAVLISISSPMGSIYSNEGIKSGAILMFGLEFGLESISHETLKCKS